jgi:hypothetical protein
MGARASLRDFKDLHVRVNFRRVMTKRNWPADGSSLFSME